MKNSIVIALLLFSANAMAAITISSPNLSPSLNEYDQAKMLDEHSSAFPAMGFVVPDSNGNLNIPAADLQAGLVSQVTGKRGAPLYKLANGKKLPLIAMVSIDPVAKAIVALSFPAAVDKILSYPSSASLGGSASETLTVTGLLASDSILAVSQSVKGANSTALVAYGSPAANALPITWTANPGAGAVVTVLVRKK